MRVSSRLRIGAASIGLCVGLIASVPAFAADDQPQGAAEATAPAGGDIVVTAMRREQRLQDVPLALVTISSAETKEQRIQNFADVFARSPGATFVPTKGAALSTPQIRGQSTINESPGLDGPVAVFIDDLYYGTASSYSSDFYDISDMAVLKGPQGTTFGRNVVGGAIQVNSAKPLFENKNSIDLTVGNYRTFEATGFFNHAFSDELAGRLSYSLRRRDGFGINQFTGNRIDNKDVSSVRGQLRYASGGWDANLSVSYVSQDQKGARGRLFGPSAVAPVALQNAMAPNINDAYYNDDGKSQREIVASVLRVSKQTDVGTITSITGYHWLKSLFYEDTDALPQDVYGVPHPENRATEKLFSQEFRLVSNPGKRLSYVFGLYLDQQNIDRYLSLNFNFAQLKGSGGCDPIANPNGNWFVNCALPSSLTSTSTFASAEQKVNIFSVAPYGEVRFAVTDQLALTAGGRFTYFRKRGDTFHVGASPFYGAPYSVSFDKGYSAFTPRAILEYKPVPDVMLFASVSRGYKSGGFSMTANSAAQAAAGLQPETSTSFEAGFKSQFLDRRITINASAFRALTKNLQVKALNGAVFVDANAGSALVKGVEVEARLKANEYLSFDVRYAFTDAKYREFKGCTSGGFDCSGAFLPFTPKNDLLVGADLTVPMGHGSVMARAEVKYADAYVIAPVNSDVRYGTPLTKQGGIVNLSASYMPDNGPWKLQLWMRNATNKYYAPYANNFYFFQMSIANVVTQGIPRDVARATPAPPRTFGATFSYNF